MQILQEQISARAVVGNSYLRALKRHLLLPFQSSIHTVVEQQCRLFTRSGSIYSLLCQFSHFGPIF